MLESKEEPIPLDAYAMRAAIAEARAAAGEIVITEDKKAAALEKLRDYGKEDT